MDERYRKLISEIWRVSEKMSIEILKLLNAGEANDKTFCYLASEGYKTIELICYGLKTLSLPQACILLRQLLENVSLLKVLQTNPEVKKDFLNHYQLKQSIHDLSPQEKRNSIVEKFKDSGANTKNAFNYLDYGWLEKLSNSKNNNVKTIIKLAGYEEILGWRELFNAFTHLGFSLFDFKEEFWDYLGKEIIYTTSILFVDLCALFYESTGFAFDFNGINFEGILEMYVGVRLERFKKNE